MIFVDDMMSGHGAACFQCLGLPRRAGNGSNELEFVRGDFWHPVVMRDDGILAPR